MSKCESGIALPGLVLIWGTRGPLERRLVRPSKVLLNIAGAVKMSNFEPHKPLVTPVLFLIFKRLDTTKQVFEQIKIAKPPRLYIAADGPRRTVQGEAEKVKAVREYVLSNIDWTCEVKTLLRDENLGCGRAVSEAITWFFENEEQGIILEDDTLPSVSFFWFCEELLDRYKDDERVWHIGGTNFQNGIVRGNNDYYFSAISHVWGWATWKNKWKHYDFLMKAIANDEFLGKYWDGSALEYWKSIFWKIKAFEIDTWDYQWTFTIWLNDGLSIVPQKNLIENIGFGAEATHTRGRNPCNLRLNDVVINKHPRHIRIDVKADDYTMEKVLLKPSWRRALSLIIPGKVKGYIKGILQ